MVLYQINTFTFNIASFSHLLKRVDFDTIVDHLALTHIIKSKMEHSSGYFLPHLIGANTSVASTRPTAEDFPMEEQPTSATPPTPVPSLLGQEDSILH